MTPAGDRPPPLLLLEPPDVREACDGVEECKADEEAAVLVCGVVAAGAVEKDVLTTKTADDGAALLGDVVTTEVTRAVDEGANEDPATEATEATEAGGEETVTT